MTPAPDGPGPDTWMLRPRVGPESTREKIAKPPLLKAVARRGLPGIVEASFVPAAIFLTARSLWDTRWAMIAVLAWGLISVLYRRWRGHRFPTLVVVAFVGLLVPHAARRLVGPAHRALLPASALLGAAFVLAADVVARTALPPEELPLGVVTSLVGVPAFLVLLRSMRARGGAA